MPAIINNVDKYSIAEDLEINPGDRLISINEIKPLDLLDYKYLTSSENVNLHIRRSNGEEEIFEIEKDFEEDIGLNFESAVFDRVIPCNNKCIFCFVDQQPQGLRDSLYIKDDDYRLSFLQGTYITLTNLTAQHRKRIETLRPGPLYVSVHTTNPDLRAYMLKNPKAKNIMDELKWLNKLEIPVHIQIVLCSEINDGKELDRTLNDLASLKSNILSIAVVPEGVTRYRQGDNISRLNKMKAQESISQIQKFNSRLGYNLAFPADELFILAEYEFPETRFYGNFGQLDDGVGSGRLLIDDFNKNKSKLPQSLNKPVDLTIATGKLAADILKPIVGELNLIKNLNVDIIPVKSNFWGDNVTVAGLVTGQDLLDDLLPVKDKKNITKLVIPSVMLRRYSHEFLDNVKVENIETCLNTNIQVIDNCYEVQELIDLIVNL